ncbi:MAG: hypothetical protein R3288_12845 [Woeseiaceae bacterium]|nr:hypothetical protein [Woeseiaceae bacterium]
MHHLLKLLFDIVLLKRGPDEVPYSWLVLNACVALWLAALFATTIMLGNFDMRDAVVAIGSAALGVGCYSVVLVATGFSARFVQTVSALVGTGALISFAMLAVLVLMTPFVGRNIANLAAFLLLVWSVPVKGHIIARAINWHWYAGIAVALAVFMLQLTFTETLTPRT